jgi:hypothetical protein
MVCPYVVVYPCFSAVVAMVTVLGVLVAGVVAAQVGINKFPSTPPSMDVVSTSPASPRDPLLLPVPPAVLLCA